MKQINSTNLNIILCYVLKYKSLSEALQSILSTYPSLSIPERSSWLVGTRIGCKIAIMNPIQI